jgi:hypothetical protein
VPKCPEDIPDDTDPVWLHLSSLLNRDYFQRMWVSYYWLFLGTCLKPCSILRFSLRPSFQ